MVTGPGCTEGVCFTKKINFELSAGRDAILLGRTLKLLIPWGGHLDSEVTGDVPPSESMFIKSDPPNEPPQILPRPPTTLWSTHARLPLHVILVW